MITPLTYPARPVNGGPLPKALRKRGVWVAQMKFNGWRMLIHVPTRTAWNRQGGLSTIAGEFTAALDELERLGFEWVDAEALERRHGIGQGSLIVLDVPGVPGPFLYRMEKLGQALVKNIAETPLRFLGLADKPQSDRIYAAQFFGPMMWPDLWETGQRLNKEWGAEYYEGIVCKRVDSTYPIQLRNPESEFPQWMKHRWRF